MKSSTSPRFWRHYRKLPVEIREEARETYRCWLKNPREPSLHFKRIRDAWSVRIGTTGYRALASQEPDGYLWFWIGPHDEYERVIRGL